jgi:GNAT superfamily N-acetyltransferase
VRQCLTEAFEPYRADYTAEMFENTVPSVAGLEDRSSEMTMWVATSSGRIVGTIAAGVTGSQIGHLRGMAVVSAFHGWGVAAQLLRTAEAELRRLGCVTVTLDTTAPLHRAMAFYEKQGYRRSGGRHPMLGMELIEFHKTL